MGKASPGKGKYGKNKSVGPSRGKGKPSFRREEGGRSDFVDDETAHAESLKERLMNKQREGGADDAKKAPGPELDDHASKLRKMLMLKKEKQKQAEGGKDTTAKFASAGAAARGAAAMSSIGQNASRKVEMEGSASPSSPVSVNVTEKEKQALRSQRFSTTPGPRKMETQSAKTSPDADLSPGDVVITVDEGARKLEGKGSAVVSVEEPKAATSSSGPAPKPASGEPKAAAAAAPAEASKPAVADPKAVATATPAAPKPAEPKASQAAAPEQPKEAAPPAKPAAAAKAAGGVARSAVVAAAKDAAKSTSVTSSGKAAPKIAEAEAATSSSPAAPKPASVEPKAAGGVARSAVVAAAKDAAKSTYVTSAGQAAPKIAEAEAPKQKPGSAPAASKPPAKPAVQSPPPKNLAPGKAVPPKAVEAKAQQRPISSGEKRKALMMGMLQRQASRRPRPALLVSGGAQALSEVAEEIQFQQKWYNQNRKRWMPYLPEESKKFRPVAPFCMERAKELEDYLRGLGAFKSR